MLFNSIEFLVFFIIVTSLYFVIPQRFRWLFLLLASYYFYMCWNPIYIFLIVISTLIDYFAGLGMAKNPEKHKRRKYLIFSLCSNLGLLFAFKYLNFFSDILRHSFHILQLPYNMPSYNLLLPVGISFYTFQALSYSIDVYRGEKQAEKHPGIFALYISFFPQLVAGPIERSKHLLPQFYNKIKFDYVRVTDGLKLMAWGLFKKMVIADRLSSMVDQVYNNVQHYQGPTLIVATVLFAFQIYCDFSGYSDIAIGAAQVLGFELTANFRRPYSAQSIAEFWRRWHISLSSWFRDYLYISLGGNRVIEWRWYYNIFIVFFLSGFWHGANWTFAIWGALNGFYLLFSIWTSDVRKKIADSLALPGYPVFHKYLRIFLIFILVCFAWIFFRAKSIGDAIYVIGNLFAGLFGGDNWRFVLSGFGFGSVRLIIAVLTIIFMEAVQVYQERGSVRKLIASQPVTVRLFAYTFIILCIIFLGNFMANQFIYFQF